MLDEATLLEYAARLGLALQRRDATTFESVVATAEGEVHLFVRLSPDWLVVSVVPFLATQGALTLDLSRWLLRMNRDLMLGKFAYDDDGDVVLTFDVPTESLDYSEVEKALRGAVDAAVRHRSVLRAAQSG